MICWGVKCEDRMVNPFPSRVVRTIPGGAIVNRTKRLLVKIGEIYRFLCVPYVGSIFSMVPHSESVYADVVRKSYGGEKRVFHANTNYSSMSHEKSCSSQPLLELPYRLGGILLGISVRYMFACSAVLKGPHTHTQHEFQVRCSPQRNHSAVLRGTIVNRAYGIHENLHI